ncbi:MAG: ATP-binding protein, partial [Acidobacteriaceae bacterium]|nr:ATP-binding protein [Acidobacteriaceae bacterium]
MSRILIIHDDSQLSCEIGSILNKMDMPLEYAAGHADALRRLRMRSSDVVITSCESVLEEDLALLNEMRAIRPGLKCIVLARESTPDEVIAAMRAHVFAC